MARFTAQRSPMAASASATTRPLPNVIAMACARPKAGVEAPYSTCTFTPLHAYSPRTAIPHPAHGRYIAIMRRSPLSRLTGLFLAMLIGLSGPSLAVAHAHAHHHAAEQAEHDREHHHSGAATASAPADVSMGASGESGDHAHPVIVCAPSTRAELPFFIAPRATELLASTLVPDQASLLRTAAPRQTGPPDAPPRQPRAPPHS